jgi:chromosome segregation ATPase
LKSRVLLPIYEGTVQLTLAAVRKHSNPGVVLHGEAGVRTDYFVRLKGKPMSRTNATTLLKVFTVIFFSLCASHIAVGQNNKQTDEQETLQALLTEVRLLRQSLQTLQRMSLDTYRSQLMVDRIRVTQEEVRRLTVSLNETREMIAKIQVTIPRNIDEQKLLDDQILREVDPQKRSALEFELKRSKEAIDSYKGQLERLKEREQEWSGALSRQRTMLEELERRLDSLDRTFESDREKLQTDKPASKEKP